MLRLNREDKSEQTKVKKHCANYNTGFTCSGVIIGSKLQQKVDSDLENKPCLISKGNKCDYYNLCVKPIADSK
tara:strand:- start:345 stop:563 length:219 start_codon:yes stop_codon:yes gene_type:complete